MSCSAVPKSAVWKSPSTVRKRLGDSVPAHEVARDSGVDICSSRPVSRGPRCGSSSPARSPVTLEPPPTSRIRDRAGPGGGLSAPQPRRRTTGIEQHDDGRHELFPERVLRDVGCEFHQRLGAAGPSDFRGARSIREGRPNCTFENPRRSAGLPSTRNEAASGASRHNSLPDTVRSPETDETVRAGVPAPAAKAPPCSRRPPPCQSRLRCA